MDVPTEVAPRTPDRRAPRPAIVAAVALLAAVSVAAAALAAPSGSPSQKRWNDHRPVVSPDGRTLAFMSDRDGGWAVWTLPLDGSRPPERVSMDPRGEWYPDWSPDGRSLVYHRSDPDRGVTFLRQFDLGTGREDALGPQDGDRAFARWAGGAAGILYVCRGTGICRMTEEGEDRGVAWGLSQGQHDPALSPDGRWIAYVEPGEDDSQDAFLLRTDGSERRRITTDPGRSYGLDWSPGGRWLSYNTEVGEGNAEVFVYEVETGRHRRLTDDPAQDHLPRWAPGGTFLVFGSDRSGSERIWRIAPDGTGLRPIDTGGAG